MSNQPEKRDWREEVEVAGGEVVDKVKEIVQQGNVRRLIIRKADDTVLLEVPLTAGVVAGGVLTFWNPVLAALGAMAALVAQLKIEIIRYDDVDEIEKPKNDELTDE